MEPKIRNNDDGDTIYNKIFNAALDCDQFAIYNYLRSYPNIKKLSNQQAYNILANLNSNACFDVPEVLFRYGLSPNTIGDNGIPAFFLTIQNFKETKYDMRRGREPMTVITAFERMQPYLEANVDINIVDSEGRNAIMFILTNGKNYLDPVYQGEKMFKLLLEYGINLNHRDNEGNSLIDYLLVLPNVFIPSHHRILLLKYFVENDLDINNVQGDLSDIRGRDKEILLELGYKGKTYELTEEELLFEEYLEYNRAHHRESLNYNIFLILKDAYQVKDEEYINYINKKLNNKSIPLSYNSYKLLKEIKDRYYQRFYDKYSAKLYANYVKNQLYFADGENHEPTYLTYDEFVADKELYDNYRINDEYNKSKKSKKSKNYKPHYIETNEYYRNFVEFIEQK